MTEQEILDIVKKAGYPLTVYEGKPYVPPMLEILLETAAAAEREACAKLCEAQDHYEREDPRSANSMKLVCADAIRARGDA